MLFKNRLQTQLCLMSAFFVLYVGLSFAALASGNIKKEQTPRQQIDYLIKLAEQLTKDAHSGNTAASSFRINVVFYRESLRDFMLAQQTNSKFSKNFLMEFVRMTALLQSAAECQTGRYIVCPAQLMLQLKQQKKRITDLYAQVPLG